MLKERIGFIGVGVMGETLIRGITSSGKALPSNIYVSDIDKKKVQRISQKIKVKPTGNNQELVKNVDIIILAVKPQVIPQVLSEVGSLIREDKPSRNLQRGKLLVSIAAGITLSYIQDKVGPDVPIIRVMPNISCRIREGISVIAIGNFCKDYQKRWVEDIFSAVGKVMVLEEKYFDAVTALSGSGPAYVFVFLEALIDAGVRVGLKRCVAQNLVLETVRGATDMVKITTTHPAVLKEEVTSPGGTTIAGLHKLEEGGFRSAIINAVLAAYQRSQQLKGNM